MFSICYCLHTNEYLPMEHHHSENRVGPRRELNGPRPSPLRVRKGKKPSPPTQHRPPVIIYTVSPKVVHADPSEFMSVVQRLTGPSSSTMTTSMSAPGPQPSGVPSPVPESLLQMPANLFSPAAPMNIGSNYVDNTFMVSPNNMVATPSDSYWELFSQDQDFKGL